MEFYPECEVYLRIKKVKDNNYLVCPYCDYKKELKEKLENLVRKDKRHSRTKIIKQEIKEKKKSSM